MPVLRGGQSVDEESHKGILQRVHHPGNQEQGGAGRRVQSYHIGVEYQQVGPQYGLDGDIPQVRQRKADFFFHGNFITHLSAFLKGTPPHLHRRHPTGNHTMPLRCGPSASRSPGSCALPHPRACGTCILRGFCAALAAPASRSPALADISPPSPSASSPSTPPA